MFSWGLRQVDHQRSRYKQRAVTPFPRDRKSEVGEHTRPGCGWTRPASSTFARSWPFLPGTFWFARCFPRGRGKRHAGRVRSRLNFGFRVEWFGPLPARSRTENIIISRNFLPFSSSKSWLKWESKVAFSLDGSVFDVGCWMLSGEMFCLAHQHVGTAASSPRAESVRGLRLRDPPGESPGPPGAGPQSDLGSSPYFLSQLRPLRIWER